MVKAAISKATKTTKEFPDEVKEAIDELKILLKKKKEISAKIKKINDENHTDELKEKIREQQEILYHYMTDNKLERVETYSLNYCKESGLKTAEKKEQKKKELKEVLETLPTDKVNKVFEMLKLT